MDSMEKLMLFPFRVHWARPLSAHTPTKYNQRNNMYYVGLTDDPQRRRAEHGNPSDWRTTAPFADEETARRWERMQLLRGHRGGTGGAGWRYGYVYTITTFTKE
jgi:hypothetical protein